ncbi:hypothetical protein RB195_011822 [Necator americanus]|uniref:Uncharacterized protein n=1 Tax=Necator americanus TaxID=51031 RepID=A0ABR1D549_NECAM
MSELNLHHRHVLCSKETTLLEGSAQTHLMRSDKISNRHEAEPLLMEIKTVYEDLIASLHFGLKAILTDYCRLPTSSG